MAQKVQIEMIVKRITECISVDPKTVGDGGGAKMDIGINQNTKAICFTRLCVYCPHYE